MTAALRIEIINMASDGVYHYNRIRQGILLIAYSPAPKNKRPKMREKWVKKAREIVQGAYKANRLVIKVIFCFSVPKGSCRYPRFECRRTNSWEYN